MLVLNPPCHTGAHAADSADAADPDHTLDCARVFDITHAFAAPRLEACCATCHDAEREALHVWFCNVSAIAAVGVPVLRIHPTPAQMADALADIRALRSGCASPGTTAA